MDARWSAGGEVSHDVQKKMFISQKPENKFLKGKLLKEERWEEAAGGSRENEGQVVIEYDRLLHLSSTCSGG